ncbi:MAG: hypothetical protein LKI34_02960 [Bifidobacterium tibiigranuli]|jgi:hypothetical protein|uniref:hypothetical protein n=1 Tax=Bifidobacterium tibiigranuli TaxID=2172043 RepID=UPI0026EFD6C7|nr:hypothetical protein [Bifidobacterium tibiigranuli]MCI1673167.1 hypothetical protein [Bifidobacterium tibiigranuli]MCI1713588.1 hypothetical protein [Bifidobacterium tibiigranuli]
MTNVSASIDWEHMTPSRLDGHRFIGQLQSGAMLDSHLRQRKQNLLCDEDDIVTVMYRRSDGRMRLNRGFTAINVLEETK